MLQRVGPQRISLRGIAVSAGIAPSTVYYHFDNKEALLGALACSGFDALSRSMAEAVKQQEQAPQCGNALRAYVGFAKQQPQLYQLMYDIHNRNEQRDVNDAERTAFAEIAKAVELDLSGRYPQDIVDGCSIAVWAAGRGIAALAISHASSARCPEAIDQAIRGLGFLTRPRRQTLAH